MILYPVDGNPITVGEEIRHRSACNAAIASGKTVAEALDVADDVIRQMRRRIAEATKPAEPLPILSFTLANDETIIEKWMGSGKVFTVPQNKVIGKMRELDRPVTLTELAKVANVRNEVVRSLVQEGILVPVEGEGR